MREIKKVSVIGMGALGLLFGSRLAEGCPGLDIEFVMDRVRAEKYGKASFEINGQEVRFPIRACEEAQPADLLLVAVKYTGLSSALETMKNCIGGGTIVLSVMNGISSERIIAERYPEARLLYSVAQGMDAMHFGNSLRYTRFGELRIGTPDAALRGELEAVAALFDKAGLPYTKDEDIITRLWSKFMLNVGINQCCMVYGLPYGRVLAGGEPLRTLYAAFREVLAVAQAEGINLTEKDISYYIDILRTLDPEGTPSMGQDRINKKPSEVDMFAGEVMALGRKHGIRVPTNEFLYEQAKAIESKY